MARKRKIHGGKIKRSKPRNFRRQRRRKQNRAVRTVLFVIVILALLIGAYCAAGPLMDWISGLSGGGGDTSSAPAQSDVASLPAEEGTSSQTSSEPAATAAAGRVKTMPSSTLTDLNAVSSFAATAKEEGYTAVAVELKNNEGKLLYGSALEQAKRYGAVQNGDVVLADVAAAIKEQGLTPVAQLHMFRDSTAANRQNNNTFMIRGQNVTWWDNSPSNGGKPWLNPYEQEAVDYLLEIIGEVMDGGFTQVVLESVQYPDVRNTSQIDFPEGANEQTHQQQLSAFIAQAQTLAGEKNGSVTVAYDMRSVLGQKDNIYFGNPLNLNASSISPVITISQFTNPLEYGGQTVENPQENPAQAVTALIEGIRQAAPDAQIIPILASDAKTDAVRDALEQAGITQVIEET